MAFDGNGNYVRVHNWQQDAANGLNISAPEMDGEDNSIAGALSLAVTRDGQGKMTADFLPATDNTLNLGSALKRWVSFNGLPIPTTQAAIGLIFYPQSNAEFNAGVTPINYFYPYGDIRRYGTNTVPGTTNMATALTNCLAVAVGGNIPARIPGGKYAVSSAVSATIPAAQGFLMTGDGSDVTSLISSGTNGVTLNYGNQFSSAHVRDISFLTTTTNTGAGLTLNQNQASIASAANTPISDVTNCTFRGADGYSLTNYWLSCLSCQSVSSVNFTNVSCTGPSAVGGLGVTLTAGATNPGVVYNFEGCNFYTLSAGIYYGPSIQGVSVSQCNLTYCTNGILCPNASGGTVLDQLAVTDSQFACLSNGILLQVSLPGVQISNCLFIMGSLSTINTTGIGCVSSGFIAITDSIFVSTGAAAGMIGVTLAGSNGFPASIQGNLFLNLTGNGIVLNNTSTLVNVSGNTFAGITTPINNQGTANVITGNFGWTTRNAGTTGAIATLATVTHGLAAPPTQVFLQPRDGTPTGVFADAFTATTFRVNYAGGTTHLFDWQAQAGTQG